MIRYIAGNLDAYVLARKLADYPTIERVSDMAVGQRPGVPIGQADKDKYDWACDTLAGKHIRHGRYINSQHAVVSNSSEKWPTNALPERHFDSSMYLGLPSELRPGVIVRRYSYQSEANRSRLADALIIEHAKFPSCDLYLDGVTVPELVDSAVPWRFVQVCDFLMKVRQRLNPDQDLGINLAGALCDMTNRHLDLLINSGVALVTFERAGTVTNAWRVARTCGKLLLSNVLPVFDVREDERAACERISDVVGAGIAV